MKLITKRGITSILLAALLVGELAVVPAHTVWAGDGVPVDTAADDTAADAAGASSKRSASYSVFTQINKLNGVKEDGSFYTAKDGAIPGNTGLDYEGDLAKAADSTLPAGAPDLSLKDDESVPKYWSYTIGSKGGQYQLEYQYQYYLTDATNSKGDTEKVAVICGINEECSNGAGIYTDGMGVRAMPIFWTEEEYKAFLAEYEDKVYVVANPAADTAYVLNAKAYDAVSDDDEGIAALIAQTAETISMEELGYMFSSAENIKTQYQAVKEDNAGLLVNTASDAEVYEALVDYNKWERYKVYYGNNISRPDVFLAYKNTSDYIYDFISDYSSLYYDDDYGSAIFYKVSTDNIKYLESRDGKIKYGDVAGGETMPGYVYILSFFASDIMMSGSVPLFK